MSVGWVQSQTENFTQEEINLDDYSPNGNPINSEAINNRDLGDFIYSCELDEYYDTMVIDWYEGYLWIVETYDYTGLVYKLNVDFCEIEGIISTSYTSDICDIEWINDYLWITDCGLETISKFNNQGELMLSFPAPSDGSVGLAWDGEYLWDICWETNTIHQMDPNTGDVIYQTSTPYSLNISLDYDNGYFWTIG